MFSSREPSYLFSVLSLAPKPRELYSSGFHLSSILFEDIGAIEVFVNINYISIYFGFSFERIARFKQLEILLLDDNKLSDQIIFAALAGLRK